MKWEWGGGGEMKVDKKKKILKRRGRVQRDVETGPSVTGSTRERGQVAMKKWEFSGTRGVETHGA